MNIQKILTYIVVAIGGIAAFLLFNMSNKFSTLMAENSITDTKDIPLADGGPLVSPLYNLFLVVFAIIVLVTLWSVISSLLKNPASLKKVLFGIIGFAVVALIAYMMSSGVETVLKDGEVLSANGSRLVSTGIWMFVLLSIIAVASMLFSGVRNILNK